MCYDAEPKSKALVPVDTIRLQRHNFHVTRGGAEVGAAPGDGAEGARFPFLVQIGAVVHTLAAESSESFAAWTSCLQQASGRRDIESTVSTPRREKAVRAPDGEGLVVSPAAGGDAGGEAGGQGLPAPEDVVVVAVRPHLKSVGLALTMSCRRAFVLIWQPSVWRIGHSGAFGRWCSTERCRQPDTDRAGFARGTSQ